MKAPRSITVCLLTVAVFLLYCVGHQTLSSGSDSETPESVQLHRLAKYVGDLSLRANLPVGSITAFSGPNVPQGWLVCDGRVLSKAEYPQLYEAIGELYGKGSNTGEFKLPDYRGMFLRGVDPEKTVDKDRDARKPPSDASKNANYLGSLQPGATALPVTPWQVTVEPAGEHTHQVETGGGKLVRYVQVPGRGPGNGDATPSGKHFGAGQVSINWPDCKDLSVASAGRHTHAASIKAGGDAETRPVNVSVQFIIKAKAVGSPKLSSGSEQEQLQQLSADVVAMSHDVDVPVGAVTAFSGPNVPQGWLVCDGRVLSKKDYPQLYEAIGELYGKGSNTGEFKLPDYRGMFLRGVGPEKTVDKDRDARKPPSDASKNANYLGSLQPGATALPVTPWQVTVEPAGEHTHGLDTKGGKAVAYRDGNEACDGMDDTVNEVNNLWAECKDMSLAPRRSTHSCGEHQGRGRRRNSPSQRLRSVHYQGQSGRFTQAVFWQ